MIFTGARAPPTDPTTTTLWEALIQLGFVLGPTYHGRVADTARGLYALLPGGPEEGDRIVVLEGRGVGLCRWW